MDHTLVIPTFNRPELLLKLIKYYKKRSPGIKILILDSSKDEIAEQNKINLSVQDGVVEYIKYPDTIQMAVKLNEGLGLVKTKYVSFCADDDIVFTEHINKAIEFLDNNPDYVTAHGRYINFQNKNLHVRTWIEYSGPGNNAEHAGARIFQLCQKYESLFYGVFKTNQLQNIFIGVARQQSLHFQELFQSVASLISGKVFRFNEIYAVRQSGSPAEPGRDKWQTYYWFASNPEEFIQHYISYKNNLWDYYYSNGNKPLTDKLEFLRILDISHAVYFSSQCPSHYLFSTIQNNFSDQYTDPTKNNLIVALSSRIALWESRLFKIKNYFQKSRKAMIRSLNEQVKYLCNNSYLCRLPLDARDLANDQSFHQAYIEICHYLDNN